MGSVNINLLMRLLKKKLHEEGKICHLGTSVQQVVT